MVKVRSAVGAEGPAVGNGYGARRFLGLVLLLIPLLLVAYSIVLVRTQGPYFDAYVDPDYVYLLNSLNITTRHAPAHADHPGTTVQELGAVVLWFRWALSGIFGTTQPLTLSVLSHPEEYLRAINLVLNLLIGLGLYLAAREAHRLSKSLLAALVLELSYFLFSVPLFQQGRVNPEPLLIASAYFLMVPLFRITIGDPAAAPDQQRSALMAGAIFGFGVVTKVTFAPLGILLLCFKGIRQKIRAAAGAILCGFLWLIPVLPRLPHTGAWYVALLLHSGQYSNGPEGLPAASVLRVHFFELFRDESWLFYLLAFYAVVLVFLWVLPDGRGKPALAQLRKVLLASWIAIALLVALTTKHFESRYLVPVLIWPGYVNAVLVVWLRSGGLRQAVRVPLALVGTAILCTGAVHSVRSLSAGLHADQRHQDDARTLDARLKAMPGCLVIGYYHAPVGQFALHFGNGFSNLDQAKFLTRLYPHSISYDIYTGRFLNFEMEDKLAYLRGLVSNGACVLLEGATRPVVPLNLPTDMALEPILAAGENGIYRLVFSSGVSRAHGH